MQRNFLFFVVSSPSKGRHHAIFRKWIQIWSVIMTLLWIWCLGTAQTTFKWIIFSWWNQITSRMAPSSLFVGKDRLQSITNQICCACPIATDRFVQTVSTKFLWGKLNPCSRTRIRKMHSYQSYILVVKLVKWFQNKCLISASPVRLTICIHPFQALIQIGGIVPAWRTTREALTCIQYSSSLLPWKFHTLSCRLLQLPSLVSMFCWEQSY